MKKICTISLLFTAIILSLIIGLLVFWAAGLHTPDYASSHNWIYLPQKNDKPVDVFYLAPTLWKKLIPVQPDIASINDPYYRFAAPVCFDVQATVFEPLANIYAPYYRQVDGVSFFKATDAGKSAYENGVTKDDIINAFDYFIQHYNNNRPFILLGHSQGADMMRYILSEYMQQHPDVYKRMIAAYPIGYSITKTYLAENPHLKFASGAFDTGVIISYNTESPNPADASGLILPDTIAINPITWTLDETIAPAKMNLGARIFDMNTFTCTDIPQLADAAVNRHRGVVVCSTIDPEKYSADFIFPKGCYHLHDISLYYYNLRANAKDRIDTYFHKL